jgi:AAA domain-containing protein
MSDEPFRLYHISELRRRSTPAIPWVVTGVVPKGGIALLVAKSGTGKTMLAYDLAACVLMGEDWLGAIPVTRGGVAYIDLDGEPESAVIRADAALRGHGVADDALDALPLFVSADYTTYDIREHDRVATLLETLAAVPELRLVIFDTYSDLHRGEEASADDMTDTMAALVEIKHALGCGLLVVHHQRKGDGAGLDDVRGSSAIIAKADAVFFLKQERDAEGLPSLCTLIQRKARHTAEAKPRTLHMEAEMEGDTLVSFRWHTTDEQPAPPTTGRPSTIFAQAMGAATRILAETPGLATKALVRRLMDQGVARTTAQRVAESIGAAQNAQKPMIWTFGQGNDADPVLPLTDK